MRPVALLVLAGLLFASPAFADLPGPVFQLEYKIMPGMGDCPAEHYARDIFTVHFGYDPFSPDAKTTLSVVARRKAGMLRVDVSARDEAGAVTWTDAYEGNVHCWALIMAAAYLAENEFVRPPPPPTCPACPEPAPSAPPPAPQTPPAPPVRSRKPDATPALPRQANHGRGEVLRFQMTAGLLGGYGIPPGASLGPTLAFAVRLPRLSLGIGINARFALSAELEGATVATSTFSSEVFACMHHKWLSACGVLGFGHLALHPAAEISILDEPNFWTGGVRVAGEWPIGDRFAVRPYVDALFPTSASIQAVSRTFPEHNQAVWTSPPVVVTLGIVGVVTF